jgi:hypothetical protein
MVKNELLTSYEIDVCNVINIKNAKENLVSSLPFMFFSSSQTKIENRK